MGTIKRLRSFREELIEAVKKVFLLFLATVMLFFFLPVGLVPEPNLTEDDGELIRISPSSEVYSDTEHTDIRKIGFGHNSYQTFNFESLAETDIDEINSVRLRLSFLTGGIGTCNNINISVLDAGFKPEKTVVVDYTPFYERAYTNLYPQTSGADDSICNIDITELIKERLDNKIYEITFKISNDSPSFILMASGKYDDPIYRPCIKAATGVKSDNESQSLQRAALCDAVYVSQDNPDRSGNSFHSDNVLKSGGQNEIYLRFDINEESILGSVHRALLSLEKIGCDDSLVKIYCINNDQWTADSISYNNRPRGNESTAFTSLSAPTDGDGRVNFDVTQAVCEARNLGIRSLTFRIVCDSEISFTGMNNTKSQPRLYIGASDDRNIACVSSAALNALGSNKASFVTMKLAEEYTSADGTDAKIRWSEYSTDGKKAIHKRIASNGNITRPKWFEGDVEVLAVAEIRSGDYTSHRQFSLAIPAEAAPDYSRYKFGNYINIGDSKSEELQKLEFIDVSGIKYRWTDGRMFSYRVPEKDGVIVLNFSCQPDAENFLTLKLWEGDNSYHGAFSAELCDSKSAEKVILNTPTRFSDSDEGFVYATYALPRSFTDGKSYISLKLTYAETDDENDDENTDNTNPDFHKDTELSARGIYSAFLTQSAYFNPKQFAKQGEKSISEPFFGEKAIEKFIENLKSLAIPTNIDDNSESLSSDEQNNSLVSISPEDNTIVFTGDEVNIAFSIDEETNKAIVYQRLEYYDRYSSGCNVNERNNVTAVDYGDYKLVWNKSTEAKSIPNDILETLGICDQYKEVISQTYYTFNDDWQNSDDSGIPDDAEVLNGKEIVVEPNSAILLMRIADLLSDSDWQISHINDKNVSEISFAENEKIESIRIKSMSDISDDTDNVTVMLGLYKGEKLSSLRRVTIPVTSSTNTYTADFSAYGIYMRKGQTMRVFVYDNTESSVDLLPKLELP